MRAFHFAALAAALVLAAPRAAAQDPPLVRGTGVPGTVHRDVAGVRRVVFDAPALLVIRPGPAELRIEGDANLVERVTSRVGADGTLVVGTGDVQVQPVRRLRLYLGVPALEAVEMTGSGELEVEGVSAPEFSFSLSGSGSARLAAVRAGLLRLSVSGSGPTQVAGRADRLEVSLSGSGSIDAEALAAGSARVQVTGSGSAALAVSGRLDSLIDGSGAVTNRGPEPLAGTAARTGAR
ncbi:GIN domain-containing protein [Longimicrobium sp.]|jgi:hypothetical protein|uniref:GIN domain-containing protein n=1 Tax=Longimicrobium sp. TaxID=2029185 RepID=UPI002ED84175